jgi:Na+/H+ antiporter NhaD/arsenite permease-like protein
MKKLSIRLFFLAALMLPAFCFAQSSDMPKNLTATEVTAPADDLHDDEEGHEGHGHESAHAAPPVWSVLPFVLLLLMIATGPLFYEHFWHHHYPKIAIALASIVVLYYLTILHNVPSTVHAGFEYVQFISLLTGLFIASGGIMINVDKKGTPMVNVVILLIGAVIANVIGTTGASMLLIRPFIRVNKGRIRAYHIIFFIFVVSNIGGSLTPIGDPPLFLGFLKGVPFFWTLTHNFLPWVFAVVALVMIFYFFDRRNKDGDANEAAFTEKVSIAGAKNFVWLLLIVGAVFLDPNVFDWVPAIHYHGQKFSFVREIIMLSVAFISYKSADQNLLKANEFNFEPIKEVAFIFIGIFGTMMPALELVGDFAQSPAGVKLISHNTLYWGTGALSGFLDNAPTYLNFLAAGMASQGASITSLSDVVKFAQDGYQNSALMLKAISVAAVFFGAFTYIGNGPNFMVKSIAEQVGIKMPSFFGYIIRYSLPILIPLFIIVWLIFFAFAI